jgi:hypothetical protein
MGTNRFRVLTPDGLISYDVYALAVSQPPSLRAGCVLLINQSDGTRLVASRTRLIAIGSPGDVLPVSRAKSVCLKCGKVEGVPEDGVVCPHHNPHVCDLLEEHAEERSLTVVGH